MLSLYINIQILALDKTGLSRENLRNQIVLVLGKRRAGLPISQSARCQGQRQLLEVAGLPQNMEIKLCTFPPILTQKI